jgi:hypothetical protein
LGRRYGARADFLAVVAYTKGWSGASTARSLDRFNTLTSRSDGLVERDLEVHLGASLVRYRYRGGDRWIEESVVWEYLTSLLTGGQLQKEYRDFLNRYEKEDPSEGYSDQEVLKRYGEVSHAVPPDQYAQAAQEALSKLSPEQLAALLKTLQDRAGTRGVTLPREVAPKPKDLGQVLTDLHKKPGQLRDMLGADAIQPQGRPSGQAAGSNPITDILASPMAKAVLAGIAAMVFKNMMGQRR